MNETEPERSIALSRWAAIVRRLPTEDWLVVAWVLGIKILLFVFAAKSYQVLENKRASGLLGWLQIWNQWDSRHYLQLAQFGYSAQGPWKAWFYPLFPWSVRVVAWVIGNYLISALVVSTVALIAAALLLRRLVEIDYSRDVALRAVWFFLIFPTAHFLHIAYTESLFLALAIGSIFAARRDRWWLAGSLGALSWMTRANGALLLPTLAMEAVHQFWTTKRWKWQWLWIGIVPLGFAVYLFLNWYITGDPFAAFRMRKTISVTSWAWPWVGLREAFRNMHRAPAEAEIVGAQEVYFALLGLACVLASWIKLRPLYAVWATGNWLLFNAVTFIESAPRYTLVLFPLFILFGLLSRNRFWNAIITVWSLLFLALFAAVFVRGWWAF
jgi:hypothetical protein